jgi:hypothetical protein
VRILVITRTDVSPILASARNNAHLTQPTHTVVALSGHALVQPLGVSLHDADVNALE